jgi:hypothetical protein
VEAACQVKEDVAKSYHEGEKVLMVHGGANKSWRFLEVSIYAEGGHKGVLWLPKGRFGWGWRRFAGELRLMLVPPNGKIGLEVSETRTMPRLRIPLTKHAGGGVDAGCFKDRSFVEVLQSKSRLELEDRMRVEAEKGGVKQRLAVEGVLESTALAAGSAKRMGGNSVKGWVNHLLGLFHLGLGRVFIGLLEGLLKGLINIPVSKRIRAVLKFLNGSKGFGLGPSSMASSTRRAFGFCKFGLAFPLKSKRAMQTTRWVRPPAFKPSSLLLVYEDHLGASNAVPSEPVRFAVYGSTPGGALLTDSELVSTSALLVAFADAGFGPSLAVRQTPPVSLLMENLS